MLTPSDDIDTMVASLAHARRVSDQTACTLVALRAADAFRDSVRAGVAWRPGALAFLDAAVELAPVGVITRLPRIIVDAVLSAERQALCRFIWCADEIAPAAAWSRASARLPRGTSGIALVDRHETAALVRAAGLVSVWLGDGGDSFDGPRWRIFPDDVSAALAALVDRPARR